MSGTEDGRSRKNSIEDRLDSIERVLPTKINWQAREMDDRVGHQLDARLSMLSAEKIIGEYIDRVILLSLDVTAHPDVIAEWSSGLSSALGSRQPGTSQQDVEDFLATRVDCSLRANPTTLTALAVDLMEMLQKQHACQDRTAAMDIEEPASRPEDPHGCEDCGRPIEPKETRCEECWEAFRAAVHICPHCDRPVPLEDVRQGFSCCEECVTMTLADYQKRHSGDPIRPIDFELTRGVKRPRGLVGMDPAPEQDRQASQTWIVLADLQIVDRGYMQITDRMRVAYHGAEGLGRTAREALSALVKKLEADSACRDPMTAEIDRLRAHAARVHAEQESRHQATVGQLREERDE